MKKNIIGALCSLLLLLTSCETEEERNIRIQDEERHLIELAEQQRQEEVRRAEQAERERIEKEIYDKYINNSLRNGATPYSYCYGGNKNCSSYGCSKIKVTTPHNSDVLVTIKKNGNVARHAYIAAGNSYTFKMPNGVYQAFFYYGQGWNPEKVMKQTSCGELKGGFVSNEYFGKDDPQNLVNGILEYELILQQHGNFSTRPSNQEDAL